MESLFPMHKIMASTNRSSFTLLFLFSHSVVSDSLRAHGLQCARLPCPSLSPRVCSNSCLLRQWYHQSFHPLSPASPPALSLSQLFTTGGQSIGASASISVLPMNIQGWFPLGLTGLISLHYFRQMKSYNLSVTSETTRCSVQRRDQGMKYGTAVLLEKYKWPNLSVSNKIH